MYAGFERCCGRTEPQDGQQAFEEGHTWARRDRYTISAIDPGPVQHTGESIDPLLHFFKGDRNSIFGQRKGP